jgi:hypothetical protein
MLTQKEKATMWQVYRNNKPIGIIETNFAFASKYWAKRSSATGAKFHLVAKG